MNDACKGFSHDDHMKISGRKNGREFCLWLIWQALNIPKPVSPGKLFHFAQSGAAADKTKRDVVAGPQFIRGLEHRIQRMTWTVVTRVHHCELFREVGP